MPLKRCILFMYDICLLCRYMQYNINQLAEEMNVAWQVSAVYYVSSKCDRGIEKYTYKFGLAHNMSYSALMHGNACTVISPQIWICYLQFCFFVIELPTQYYLEFPLESFLWFIFARIIQLLSIELHALYHSNISQSLTFFHISNFPCITCLLKER
jgi:hypothetical protein